jgi:peptide/nickel transport system substrate-binding protein
MGSHKLVFACILLIISTSIHCSRVDRAKSEDSTIIVGTFGDESIFHQEHWGMEATFLMFLPLVESMYGYHDPQPALAERWEHSEDYKEWTFHLRKNVKWHDGEPATAHDIKFTFDLRRQLNLGWGAVEILDDYIFKVTYPFPKDGLDSYDVFYPKHLLENLDPEEFFYWEFWTHPVGNGPYRYVRHVPKTMVELEANPDYYRGKPKIERVVLRFIENYLTELLSGNIDAAGGLNSLDLLAIKKDPRFRTYHGWGNQTGTIYWNHDFFLFQSPEIRRALTLAINRYELAEVLNYPEGVPLKDTIMTIRQFLRGSYPDPLPYDADQARTILEKHGWQDTDGDGIREREGKEFRFLAHISSSLPGAEECAIYVQDQFRKVGIRMEIQALERNLLVKRIRNRDFQAIFFLIDGSLNQPNFGDARIFGKKSPLGYNNPEMIRLLEEAQLEFDPDKLDKIYEKIMPIFTEDIPMTMLLPWTYSSVAHKKIKGLSNIRVDPIWSMEHLWIEEE